MSNSLQVCTFVAKYAFAELMSQCKVIQSLDTEYFTRMFKDRHGGKVKKGGATVYMPKPMLGSVRESWEMNTANESELAIPVTIDTVRGIDIEFTEAENFHTIEEGKEFSDIHVAPKVRQLAATIDAYCGNYMKNNIFNCVPVDTIGTDPDDIKYYMRAGKEMKQMLVPLDSPLNCIQTPSSEASMADALSGQYNPNKDISGIFRDAQIKRAAGFDWHMSQTLPSHIHGTNATTNGTVHTQTTGTTSYLVISGVTNGGTLKQGDTFHVTGQGQFVNFQTKTSMGDGAWFVCNADTTASGTSITVNVKPDIYITGPHQNLSATVVGGAVAFDQSTDSQAVQNDLVLHRRSFALAFADLYKPKSVEEAGFHSEYGVSVRYIKGFDITNSDLVSRLDVFFGIRPARPEWAAKVIY